MPRAGEPGRARSNAARPLGVRSRSVLSLATTYHGGSYRSTPHRMAPARQSVVSHGPRRCGFLSLGCG